MSKMVEVLKERVWQAIISPLLKNIFDACQTFQKYRFKIVLKYEGEGLASDYLTSSLAAFTMRSGYRPPSLQRIGNSSKSTGKDILDKKFTITLTFKLVFKP